MDICSQCAATPEWRCEGLDMDGQVASAQFACGDPDDLLQTIAFILSHSPAVSVNVIEWVA